MRLLLALLLAVSPTVALSGAWPRAEGETFVALSWESDDDWIGLYAERGIGRDLTLGLDLGGKMQWNATAGAFDGEGRAIAFLRWPTPVGEGTPWQTSLEVGVGTDFDVEVEDVEPMTYAPRLRLGANVGRGFQVFGMDGWGDLGLRIEPGGDETRYGLGFVTGIKPMPRLTTSIGLFVEVEEETSITVTPKIGLRVWRDLEVQLGAALKDGGDRRVVLGLALTF
jgi:hypothetical protein